MGGSKDPRPVGKAAAGADILPPRTPGPLGKNDAADPNSTAFAGDSPGPLGINDGAQVCSPYFDWRAPQRSERLPPAVSPPARLPSVTTAMGEILGGKDVVPLQGDPAEHPNYVQKAVRGVGILGWGGPFRLDRKIVNGSGVDSVALPRDQVNLDWDPLKGLEVQLRVVYQSRATADQAVAAMAVPGAFAYYIGPGGYIYPTIISDTTAPALCAALRKALELERSDAKAAEKTSIELLLWYVGARFPLKTGTAPPRAAAGPAARAAAGGGEKALVVVEIGSGDLKASIALAKRGGAKVIAVDPVAPAAGAARELEAAGGTFIKGTAESLSPATADHVFQYFPWRIDGAGSYILGGTWRLIRDTVRILKSGGAAHFVTEDFRTAQFLAKEASSHGLKAVITETTAAAAAPGASGAGVPGFSKALKVWLVNVYK